MNIQHQNAKGSIGKTAYGYFLPFAIAAIYYAIGSTSLLFASINSNASPFWPATGFAIAAAAIYGRRALLGIFLGAALTNLNTNIPLVAIISIAAGNALESFIGAFLFHRTYKILGKNSFRKPIAIVSSILPSTILGATIGSLTLFSNGVISASETLYCAVTWWGGDFVGGAVFLPLFLRLEKVIRAKKTLELQKILAFVFLASATLIVNTLVFVYQLPEGIFWTNSLLSVLGFIFVSKLASRIHLVIMSLSAMYYSHLGYTLFEFGSDNLNILYLQGITSCLALSTLFIECVIRPQLPKISRWVFFSGMPIIIIAVSFLAYEEKILKDNEFKNLHEKTLNSITQAEHSYTTLLLSAAGILEIKGNFSSEEWRKFANTMQLNRYFGAVNGIGFIKEVQKNNFESYLAEMKGYGIKDLKVFSLDPEYSAKFSNRYIISYIEPLEKNLRALGLDLGSESRRRATLERSRREKIVLATPPISLVQDRKKGPGFLVLYPAWKETFIGWAYLPVISEIFFDSAFLGVKDKLHIAINFKEESVYEQKEMRKAAKKKSRYYSADDFTIFGVPHKISIYPKESFFLNNSGFPLVIGVILTLLLTILTTLVSNISQFNSKLVLEVDRKRKELDQERVKTVHSAKLASLGEMSAGIAHEINNPLAIINGSLAILSQSRQEESKFQEKIGKIARASQRIEKIVNGLRKFSRTSGENQKKLEDLKVIIQESILLASVKSKQSFVELRQEFEGTLVIHADALEIEQVLINLIANGIDAAKSSSEKWVKIIAKEEPEAIVLQVIDSGKGISKEIEEKLFQPFFTTKPVGSGTGLGLSISKGILDQHKAKFFLNRNHSNTCFEIRFPKAVASNRAA